MSGDDIVIGKFTCDMDRPTELNALMDDIVADWRADPDISAEDRAMLAQVKPGDFRVTDEGHRIGGVYEAFLVAFAGGLGKAAAQYVWDRFIRPALDRKFGGQFKEAGGDGGQG
ncbi:MAG: hypothetical protein EP335_03760 [Alphaproteobacteria bacterium]|nr:MAG: hypothetical protein EP335_03760 [Alphaproteobacteria bacterium]